MTSITNLPKPVLQRIILGTSLVILLIVTAVGLWTVLRPRASSGLKPWLPEPTAIPVEEPQQIPTIAFADLNNDPLAYLNRKVQVSGDFLVLSKPECIDFSGPSPQWALISENLQLDTVGFERIVSLLEPGTSMIVQGIWRHYEGPYGCGKEPPRGSAWYLEVNKIIQPNPIVRSGQPGSQLNIENGDPGFPELQPTPVLPETQVISPTPLPSTGLETIIPSPTLPSDIIVTETPQTPGTPFATITPLGTNNAPVGTATAGFVTTTPGGGPTTAATATSIPGNLTPTLTPENPPIPPTATETNGGYPGDPTATPAPTSTPRTYP